MAKPGKKSKVELDEELSKDSGSFYQDPLGWVLWAFPWDTDLSIQMVELQGKWKKRYPDCKYGPDEWACEFLWQWGQEIKKRGFDGVNAVDPIRFSTVSGHGIGKSTLTAWLILFIMSTRPYCKGVVTAGTDNQLKTKTWSELGKWYAICLTRDWFDLGTGRGAMNLTHRKHKMTWRTDALTSRAENSEAFAGLHAANSTPFYIFDEASQIDDVIYEVREGGGTDGEPMSFDFGNPTRNSGRFFENCEGAFKHRYIVRQIDSRSVQVTNKKLFKEWLEDYGEDSDFFKVRVRGMFPSAGSHQFMRTDEVIAAQEREVVEDITAPLVIGVDVARFGDDESVIYPRIGNDCRSWPIERYKGIDTVAFTGRIVACIRKFRQAGYTVSAIFVDGTGIGGAVVDQLRHLGYNPIEVQFGSRPMDSLVYRYKSDELWGNLRDAMPNLCLPAPTTKDGLDLKSDLTKREYAYTLTDRIHLETKKLMKERGLDSPDLADALALTFTQDVAPIVLDRSMSNQANTAQSDYDPLEADW